MFGSPEEMEYLGQIKNGQFNGCGTNIKFDVWRRQSFGQPDLFASYNGQFFARCYDNKVDSLLESVRKMFFYEGAGHQEIFITVGVSLSPEVFREQTKALLTEEEIKDSIFKGRFYTKTSKNGGQIKYCPECKAIRQTSCSACGCGSCETCNHSWVCQPTMLDSPYKPTYLEIYPPLEPSQRGQDEGAFPVSLL